MPVFLSVGRKDGWKVWKVPPEVETAAVSEGGLAPQFRPF
jgi:hypothetical protein